MVAIRDTLNPDNCNNHLHHRHVGTVDDPDFSAAHPRSAPRWFLRFFRTYYTHAQLGRITAVAIGYLLLGASLLDIAVFRARLTTFLLSLLGAVVPAC